MRVQDEIFGLEMRCPGEFEISEETVEFQTRNRHHPHHGGKTPSIFATRSLGIGQW